MADAPKNNSTALDWKSLIEIDTSLSPDTADADRAQISAILDKVAASPKEQDDWLGKLQSRLGNKKQVITTSREQRSAVHLDGAINVNPDQISASQYCGTDGQYHRLTLEQVVIHEVFGHVAADNANKIMLAYGNNILGDPVDHEPLAVDITNAIQKAIHSKDVPRGDYYDVCADTNQAALALSGYHLNPADIIKFTHLIPLCDSPPEERKIPLATPKPISIQPAVPVNDRTNKR